MPAAVGVPVLILLVLALIVAFVLELGGFTLPTWAWQMLAAVVVVAAMIVWDVTF